MPIIAGLSTLIANANPNKRTLSIRLIDATGDQRAVSFRISNVATDQAIADFVDEFANLTQSVVWSVEVGQVFGVVPSNALATSDAHSSVYDNVVVLYKSSTGLGTDLFIPAPIEALILEGDVVDTSNATFTALTGADMNAIATLGTPVKARFTERREINTAVSM